MTTKEDILHLLRINKNKLLKFGVNQIGLFGSYLRDEQTINSDIDLLIDFTPAEESFDNLMAAYDVLETIFKDKKIDIVTKNGLSQYIGPEILKEVCYA